MKVDPYREMAKKNRQPIQKVQSEEENDGQESSLSRTGQREENTGGKYPLLKTLLIFFIFVPVITFIGYSFYKDKPQYSTAISREEDPGPSELLYELNESSLSDDEETEDTQEENETKAEDQQPKEEAVNTSVPPEEPVKEEPPQQLEKPQENQEPEQKQEPEPEPDPVEPSGKVVYHTVKPQETVFRIAMNYYQSQEGIAIIREANNLNGNEIHTGQVLKIPLP
ncbi:MAG TPA: LysM peptidoglycan-binding domain-containing protein [Chondromyces sp.]|nr:LysM peptidoglycan-binding domain-containing protein [Chondromyces sp.]